MNTPYRRSVPRLGALLLALLALLIVSADGNRAAAGTRRRPGTPATTTQFAIIGDFGVATPDEQDVANLVRSWSPDFIITVGDNNYPDGAASTIDPNIGQYYHDFIAPYFGKYGPGAAANLFFPSLGNHDWNTANAQPYLDYFSLPGNERYYDRAWGPVHLFAVDSDPHEPDGIGATSTQALWLQARLAAAPEPWKIVYFHHPPYTSTGWAQETTMQWPFQQWGATAVITGHAHNYERLVLNGFPYFVDGLGGGTITGFGTPAPGSVARYSADFGAMRVQAASSAITFQFFSRTNLLVDTYTINGSAPTATPTPTNPPARTPTMTRTATNTRTRIPAPTMTPVRTPTSTPTNPPARTPTSTRVVPTPTPAASPCAGTPLVVNGDFESGLLSGWSSDGVAPPPVVSSAQAHSGRYAVLLGSITYGVEPSGDSAISQALVVPAGGGTLSFWFWPHSRDTVTYDWQDAYLTDAQGTVLATLLHVAWNSETWTNMTYDLAAYAGLTVRIKFLVHEEGYGDETGMYVDDVTVVPPGGCGKGAPGAPGTPVAAPTPTRTAAPRPARTPTAQPTSTPRTHPAPSRTPAAPPKRTPVLPAAPTG